MNISRLRSARTPDRTWFNTTIHVSRCHFRPQEGRMQEDLLADTKNSMKHRMRIMLDSTAELLLVCRPLRSGISDPGRHLALILHFKCHRGKCRFCIWH
ncbi:hypothetical protein V2G26_006541 [Clonostachys chloroleuca]